MTNKLCHYKAYIFFRYQFIYSENRRLARKSNEILRCLVVVILFRRIVTSVEAKNISQKRWLSQGYPHQDGPGLNPSRTNSDGTTYSLVVSLLP